MAVYTTFKENFLRVIAVVGLIAILLLGAWGIIQLAFYLPTFFSNFGRARESVAITLPAQSQSDKPFNLVWKHAGKQDTSYTYTVSYSCAEGLEFAIPKPQGPFELVPCNTPVNFIGATSSMPIIPVLSGDKASATTTITVTSTKTSNNTVTAKGTARTTVSASTTAIVSVPGTVTGLDYTPATTTRPDTKPVVTKPTTSTKPTTTYVPSGRTTNLYGKADLAVHITTSPQSAAAGARATLQFVVTNIGTNMAPAGWSFTATLPYNPLYYFPSGGQQKLYPGDKIVYTLGYDVVPSYDYYGQAQATIQVDPNNYVAESSEYNNSATATYQVY